VHELGYYRRKHGIRPADFLNAYLAERLSLALPLYAQMTNEEQDFVCQGLRDAFDVKGVRRGE